jgi:hypothetical protein
MFAISLCASVYTQHTRYVTLICTGTDHRLYMYAYAHTLQVDRCHRVVVAVDDWPLHPKLRIKLITHRCMIALDVNEPPKPAIKVTHTIHTLCSLHSMLYDELL